MNLDYRVIEAKEEWDEVLSKFSKRDIFFEYDFLDLHSSEGEKPVMVYMENEAGKIAYPFLLRDISFHDGLKDKLDKDKYYDISTHYGYGGHLVEVKDDASRKKIIKLFYERLAQFCRRNNVVSEFVKFSPLLNNHEGFENEVELLPYKKMMVSNLQDYGDPLYSEVSASTRKFANKCRQMGIRSEIVVAPKSFEKQLAVYYNSMDRKGASDYYYYSKGYFEKMMSKLPENLMIINLIFEDRIIGFGLYFLYDKFIYAFVAGVEEEYTKLYTSYLLSVDAINWGYKNGYSHYFLGGGLSTSEDDSLYLFKRHFTRHSGLELFLGHRIWNKEAYDYLVSLKAAEIEEGSKFFPLYRF
jgi:hypothetical protein